MTREQLKKELIESFPELHFDVLLEVQGYNLIDCMQTLAMHEFLKNDHVSLNSRIVSEVRKKLNELKDNGCNNWY